MQEERVSGYVWVSEIWSSDQTLGWMSWKELGLVFENQDGRKVFSGVRFCSTVKWLGNSIPPDKKYGMDQRMAKYANRFGRTDSTTRSPYVRDFFPESLQYSIGHEQWCSENGLIIHILVLLS